MRTIMKRTVLYAVALLGFATLLVQCVATQQDVEYTNTKVRKMDTRVEEINKQVEELKKQTVQDVQARQAQTGDRLDYQQSEILRLQGEIEENRYLLKQVQEENKELKQMLLGRLDSSEQTRLQENNKLNDRLALSEEQMLKAQDRITLLENEINSIKEARSKEAAQRAMEAAERAREAERKAQMAAEQKAVSPPREILPDTYKIDVSSKENIIASAEEKESEQKEKSTPAPEVKTAPPSPPPPAPPAASNAFDRGMNLFKQKQYRDAYNSFAEYLDKNPSGSQAVAARYYSAESLFAANDYELAILEFQKVIVEHPKDDLASKALYKQGLSFEKIGDPETARIVYNKLIDTYPQSAEVASAKSRLESLKR